jgi:hypothetical protein
MSRKYLNKVFAGAGVFLTALTGASDPVNDL